MRSASAGKNRGCFRSPENLANRLFYRLTGELSTDLPKPLNNCRLRGDRVELKSAVAGALLCYGLFSKPLVMDFLGRTVGLKLGISLVELFKQFLVALLDGKAQTFGHADFLAQLQALGDLRLGL